MLDAATNTDKFCIATGGPVLASGEHVTGIGVRSLLHKGGPQLKSGPLIIQPPPGKN